MHQLTRNILAAAILVGIVTAGGMGGPKEKTSAPQENPPKGSKARQLLLKIRLRSLAGETLAESLQHNRLEWLAMSPDQRERYRREALAFLRKDQQQQEELLRRYDMLTKMPPEKRQAYRKRAKWLKVVVASLTPDERRELAGLSPEARARRLLARKAELIRQGKLSSDETTAASAPTTTPATTPTATPTTAPAAPPQQ